MKLLKLIIKIITAALVAIITITSLFLLHQFTVLRAVKAVNENKLHYYIEDNMPIKEIKSPPVETEGLNGR